MSRKVEQILQRLAPHRRRPGLCLIGENVDDHQVVLAAQFLDRAALGYHTVLPLITIAASAISPDPVSRMAAQNHPAYLPEVVLGADPEGAQAFGQRLQDEFGFVPALDHLSVPGLCATCTSSSG